MINEFKEWMTEIREDAIEDKKDKAKAKGDESKWKSEIWLSGDKNKAIKKKFKTEGDKRGYESRPSSEPKKPEWLYDFVWRELDAENNLLGLKLAMEIEFSAMNKNKKGIKYDFNKLLQADSEYKVLVFQLKTENDVSTELNNFEKFARVYRTKVNSKFLLCGWSTALNEFIFSDFVTEV